MELTFGRPKILIFSWNMVENHWKTAGIWKLNGMDFGEIFDDLPSERSQDPPFSMGEYSQLPFSIVGLIYQRVRHLHDSS